MSNIKNNCAGVLRNITNTNPSLGKMDSQIQNLSRETQVEAVENNSPTNVFDPGIMANPDEASLPRSSFTKEDAMKNCSNWVDKQQQLHEAKRKRAENDDDDEDVCDLPDANEVNFATSTVSSLCSGVSTRRRIKGVRMKDERLNLKCEWQACDFVSTDLEDFVRHVSMHIPLLDVRINEDGEEVYVCLWECCGFESVDPREIVRHVNFHSYHTKVKCIGSNMVARLKLPPCTYDENGRNLVPDLPGMLECGWEDCDRTFNNSQMYFFHVQAHVQTNPRGRFVKNGVPCSWRGCRSVFRTMYKLSDHVRSHTQEKVAACPTCGGLFASKTKFFDHCKRQIPIEFQGYQCSHCSKYYPSERLLRDHMRHHVNHYKCTFCDMTCPTPSSLSLHIRYRHLDSKPFKCPYCDYTAKTQNDMKNHVNTHCSDALYHCEEEDCDFSCRSAYGLNRHYHRYHRGDEEPLYCCHICEERFFRGFLLTKHLFAKHSFRWPSGHCRFRYKHEEDGFFRLQTVRYESLEVTEEMMQSESQGPQQEQSRRNSRYNLRQLSSSKNEVPISFTLSEDEDDPDTSEPKASSSRILISIEELDSSGNVVRSKMIEAEEMPDIPPGPGQVTLIQNG